MKKLLITVLIPLCGYAATAQTKRKPVVKKTTKPVTATAVKFQTTLDSASYAFGSSMGASLKNDGLKTLNYDLLVKGLKDAFGAQAPLLSQEACQQVIGNLFKGLSSQKFASNINEGKTFLENNKKNAGVKTTASGLQYLVLTEGTGPKPAETDTVLVNYRGTLLNGTEFDSSYKRNEPLSLNLDRVIPGWTEGMQLMPAGSKYKFFIPYQLAYGERGAGEDIPPYSTLIFEIELLKVNGK
jgi:FKBP-type peptidyl-prolyl cis-trans isomerase